MILLCGSRVAVVMRPSIHQSCERNSASSIMTEIIAWFLQSGESPLQMGPKAEESSNANSSAISFYGRLILGTLAGSYYFILPVYMWFKNLVWPKSWAM